MPRSRNAEGNKGAIGPNKQREGVDRFSILSKATLRFLADSRMERKRRESSHPNYNQLPILLAIHHILQSSEEKERVESKKGARKGRTASYVA